MDQRLSLSLVTVLFLLTRCSSGNEASSDDEGDNDATFAETYADFGETVSNAVPDGLKTGVAAASMAVMRDLSGTCAGSYTDCPGLTASGGADSLAGEILSRLWALDYDDECTKAFITDGTCFTCTDCVNGAVGSNYIKPTLLADPESCAGTSTTEGRYVNFGIDPCYFDTLIGQIDNMEECLSIEGASVDISTAVPWYASWNLPQSVNFSGYQEGSSGSGGLWWTVNSGSSDDRFFIFLDPDWLYGGVRDVGNNRFLFFGTGSPSYYEGLSEGSGINIAAYAGSLSSDNPDFEAIQIRDQPPNSYIYRIRSNGSHLWAQYWQGDDFPGSPEEAEGIKDSPTETRCVEIGTNIPLSKYVPLGDCVTSFGAASVDELDRDSNYALKIVDGETAGSIGFTTSLTSAAETSCTEEGD